MKLTAFFLIVLTATCTFAADLQQQLEALANAHQGKVALYAKQLKTGATVAISADTPVKTASVIKLPIMIEAFTEAKAGKLNLADRLTLTKENQVPGSGILTALSPGLMPTVEDTITLMIQLSDNTGTNMMIDKVGVAAVDQMLVGMGMKNTWLYKKVFKPADGPMPADQKQFGLGKTTAREMAEIMASVDRCDLGDAALCKRMLDILKGQHDRDDIPRYIEVSDTSEKPSAIANKTGALDDVRNDVALVYTTGGPIVISAFTWDNKDQTWTSENTAQKLIGQMAKLIVDAWAPRGVLPAPAAAKKSAPAPTK
jgi:beta-lactamase class A